MKLIKITKEDIDQIAVHFIMIVTVAASFIQGVSLDLLILTILCLVYVMVTVLLEIRAILARIARKEGHNENK